DLSPVPGSFVVNTTDDILRGNCITLCSLRDALTLAPAGSTITFSVTGTITLINGIPITQPVTVMGPGPDSLAVTALNGHDIFDVYANPVTISGLELAQDYATTQVIFVHTLSTL